MKINLSQSLIGGAVAFLISTSCCWLPFLVIGLGGASGIAAFSAGLEKFSGLFMIVGPVSYTHLTLPTKRIV